ncbi:MAG: queuosine precursor transporter [Candidatus Kerfeldbacteria bacterium]|nr:queuosine precursor transporter [Candidatus Kerfeldbacteria bacterium]
MFTTYTLLLLASSLPLLGAWYARKTNRPDGLIALYAAFVVLSQIFAAKIAIFDFGFTSVTTTAATTIFAVTFLVTDMVNEKFGRRETIRMILIAFVIQVAMVLFSLLVTKLGPAPFWNNQGGWEAIFGIVPRITLASLITYLVSENFDAFVYHAFRRWTRGRFLWMRNAFSSLPALTIDTVLFVTLAFAGTGIPLWPLMLGQFVAKWFVGIIDIPFMYLNRLVLGRNLAAPAVTSSVSPRLPNQPVS